MKNSSLINRLFLMFSLCWIIAYTPVQAQQSGEIKLEQINRHERAVSILEKNIKNPFIEVAPDGYYYLTGTLPDDLSSDKKSTIKVWRSKDLVVWEAIPDIKITEKSKFLKEMLSFSKKRNIEPYIFSPEVHFVNNRWVIVHTSGSRVANVMLSASSDIQGPYTEPLGLEVGFQVDPTIFVDDDGTPWLISNCTQIRKIKNDFSDFAGSHRLIGPKNRQLGFEGTRMIKIGGKYVLFGTSWSTDIAGRGTYNLYYTTADHIMGPYSPRKFAGRSLGNGAPFKDKNGRWWVAAQGAILVPLDIQLVDGNVVVVSKDPDYRFPGKEEVQKF